MFILKKKKKKKNGISVPEVSSEEGHFPRPRVSVPGLNCCCFFHSSNLNQISYIIKINRWIDLFTREPYWVIRYLISHKTKINDFLRVEGGLLSIKTYLLISGYFWIFYQNIQKYPSIPLHIQSSVFASYQFHARVQNFYFCPF